MSQTRREFLVRTAGLAALAQSPWTLSGAKPSSLASYDALGLAELIRKKEISPLELMDDIARRIARVNGKLNVVLEKNFDFDRARDQARAAAGAGMFAGVPVMLKNLVGYTGARIDSGSRLYAEYIARGGKIYDKNSPLVDAMIGSGMIIAGVTNAPELGLIDSTEPLAHGASHSPWNPEYTTGGSSGGTGGAIAAGIIPMAHGNDGGGSIRIPSSQCGVFGLKPTRGRELGSNPGPRGAGHDELSLSNNLCLSRSVRDTAAFLSVVEDPHHATLKPVGFVRGASKKRLKIGFAPLKPNGEKPHAEVMQSAEHAARLCEKLGHHVEETKTTERPEFQDAFIGLWASGTLPLEAQAKQWLGPNVKLDEVLEPWTLGLMETAKKRGAQNCVNRALDEFGKAVAALQATFRNYDVILTPVLAEPPFKIGWHAPTVPFDTLMERVLGVVAYTPLHNACGTTAMSVPLYWTRDGLPVGTQFAAWRGNEAMLLSLAYELEAAQPWAKKHPPIFAA